MAIIIVKRYLVDILVKKISTQETNPKTNESFKVGDILIAEYKIEVENALLELAKVV
ncbi:hypothetical protein [Clostridium estertheticum]|uniref:hypothetical protein n=1 Tax=Clostridium estertheticum TaxID=238834 RepID=UPI001CF46F5C|nr:hypothetical protein [Clostridium estertheticum]MCB2340909.1 hypothetical protein [Clostridium estertheticum]